MSESADKKPCPDCEDTGFCFIVHGTTQETHKLRCPCKENLPIRFIFQPEKSGCGVAALAMVAGTTYREARQYFAYLHDFTQEGIYHTQLEEALVALGFAHATYSKYQSRLGGAERRPWPPQPVSNMAICQVKNLRDACWHYVVLLRDGRVLDPAVGVVQGLYRYPEVANLMAVYRIPEKPSA